MASLQKALQLIPLIHDAVLRKDAVEPALAAIARAFDGYLIELALQVPGGEGGRPPAMYSSDANREKVATYAEYFHTIDPGFAEMQRAPVRKVVSSDSIISPAEYRRTEFYNDFQAPDGLSWGPNYSVVLAREDERLAAFVALARQRGAAPLDAEGVELFGLLASHFVTMRSIWTTLQELSSQEAMLTDTLDFMPTATFIIDGSRRVIWANRLARELAGARDGLYIDDGLLRAEARSVSRPLETLLGEAVRTGRGDGLSAGGTLLAPRSSGARPLEVRIAPLPLESAFQTLGLHGVAVLFATDPDAAPPDAPEVLAALYGLTPTECRVAMLLVQDLAIPDVADRLGITLGTVRTHLKSLMKKTDTNRQASLIRLLVRGPASLAIPPNGS